MPRTRLYAALVTLSLLAASVHAEVDPELSGHDAFIAGILFGFIDRELDWPRDSYRLTVRDGIAKVTLPAGEDERRRALETDLPPIEGLQGLNVVERMSEPPAAPAAAATGETQVREKVYSTFGLTPDTVPFPTGDLFQPLLADPKQPQFFVSVREYDTPSDETTVAAVGYGETFGLYRRAGRHAGDGLQVSISGALFAQFNVDAPSNDLVNADYNIGFPITWRRGPLSARLRLYHQSSHLGDEYLLRAQPERVNLSFESLEFLGSYEWRALRGYLGGETLLHREPDDLDRNALHYGVELRPAYTLWGGRPLAGLDVKRWEEHDWSPDYSLKAGLEYGAARPGLRRLRVMAEAYDGHAPHGQFYDDSIDYYGIGIYLGF